MAESCSSAIQKQCLFSSVSTIFNKMKKNSEWIAQILELTDTQERRMIPCQRLRTCVFDSKQKNMQHQTKLYVIGLELWAVYNLFKSSRFISSINLKPGERKKNQRIRYYFSWAVGNNDIYNSIVTTTCVVISFKLFRKRVKKIHVITTYSIRQIAVLFPMFIDSAMWSCWCDKFYN